jgi:hypothetical protein
MHATQTDTMITQTYVSLKKRKAGFSSHPSENSYPLSEAQSNQFCVGDAVFQVPQKHFTVETEYVFQVSK